MHPDDDLKRRRQAGDSPEEAEFPEVSPQCTRGSEICSCCLQALEPADCDCPALELVALNVRRLRIQREMSQQELSSRANIHRTHLARFETQATNISLVVLFKLARGLNVDPRELLRPRTKHSRHEQTPERDK